MEAIPASVLSQSKWEDRRVEPDALPDASRWKPLAEGTFGTVRAFGDGDVVLKEFRGVANEWAEEHESASLVFGVFRDLEEKRDPRRFLLAEPLAWVDGSGILYRRCPFATTLAKALPDLEWPALLYALAAGTAVARVFFDGGLLHGDLQGQNLCYDSESGVVVAVDYGCVLGPDDRAEPDEGRWDDALGFALRTFHEWTQTHFQHVDPEDRAHVSRCRTVLDAFFEDGDLVREMLPDFAAKIATRSTKHGQLLFEVRWDSAFDSGFYRFLEPMMCPANERQFPYYLYRIRPNERCRQHGRDLAAIAERFREAGSPQQSESMSPKRSKTEPNGMCENK